MLSSKTKAKLETANAPKGKGDVYEKLWAMVELIKDPESQSFFDIPEINKQFIEYVKDNIKILYGQVNEASLNEPVYVSSDGSVVKRGDSLASSLPSVIEELEYKNILSIVQKQIPCGKFSELLTSEIQKLLNRDIPLADKIRLLGKNLTYYETKDLKNKNSAYNQYQKLKEPAINHLTVEVFEEKLFKVLHKIKEMLESMQKEILKDTKNWIEKPSIMTLLK